MDTCREDIVNRLNFLFGSTRDVLEPPSDNLLYSLDSEIAAYYAELEKVRQAQLAVEVADNARRTAEAAISKNWISVTLETELPTIPFALLQEGREESLALAGEAPLGLWLWVRRLLFGNRLRQQLYKKLELAVATAPVVVQKEILSMVERDYGYKTLALAFQRLILYRNWLEKIKELREAEKQLQGLPETTLLAEQIKELKEQKSNISKELLKVSWTRKVIQRLEIVKHEVSRYFELADKLRSTRGGREWVRVLDDFTDTIKSLSYTLPVWIVTNLSARRSLPLQPKLFDLVIIDEASQCDIPSALPLLFRARRAIIIGDPQQLRHISTIRPDREAQLAEENEAKDLLTDWSYTTNSLYDVAEAAILRKGDVPIFLAEHYRSHPAVVEFSNRVFYQGKLVLRTKLPILSAKLEGQLLGVFWHDVKGHAPESSRSACNEVEVSAVIDLLNHWWKSKLLSKKDLSFGIVTPFRLQMEKIEQSLQEQPWWDEVRGRLIVGTAHRFQGDECDIMIFSPVVSEGLPKRRCKWVAETDQLLNVAITRARGALHVVGDLDSCRRAGSYLAKFAEYVASGSIAGQSTSRFDSPAEERMAELLDEIGVWYLPQYNEGRYRFDFFVVSPFGKRYDIEVDGREHWSHEQLQKDAVRDKTVEALGYQVIRIDARDIFTREHIVRARLSRLI